MGHSASLNALNQFRPKYTSPRPSTISTSPSRRKALSGVVSNSCIHFFILSGAAKYGRPSRIITMPNTHKKNFIEPISYWKWRLILCPIGIWICRAQYLYTMTPWISKIPGTKKQITINIQHQAPKNPPWPPLKKGEAALNLPRIGLQSSIQARPQLDWALHADCPMHSQCPALAGAAARSTVILFRIWVFGFGIYLSFGICDLEFSPCVLSEYKQCSDRNLKGPS